MYINWMIDFKGLLIGGEKIDYVKQKRMLEMSHIVVSTTSRNDRRI